MILGLLMAVIGFLACVSIAIGHHVKTGGSWRHYVMGRHLMEFIVVMGLIYGALVVSFAWGPFPIWIWAIFLGLMNAALIHRNWLLFTSAWRLREVKEDRYSDYTQEP